MRKIAIAVGLASALLASSASAAVLDWTFKDVTFDGGGALTGSLSYDNVLNTLVAWDFTTTAGAALPGFHYDNSNSTLFGVGYFGSPNSFTITRNNPFAEPYAQLTFTSSLAVAGAVTLATAQDLSGSWECNNCSDLRYVTGGNVVTSAVPEPATWALLITGFGLAGSAIRRRSTVFRTA